MKKQDYHYLGKIVSKFSFKGEVLIKLETNELADHKFCTFFIEIDGQFVPFKVKQLSKHKSKLLRVKLNDVDSESKAISLIKKDVYMPIADLPRSENKKFYFNEIIGYKMIDIKTGYLGKVVTVDTQTPQLIAMVKNQKNVEIIIPIVDDFIEKIDSINNEITVSLPEGLTKINL
tara:strand:+ start:95 stop:619 length:525 start_codon:yes stop_codon:yes gene_type:complete